MLSYNIHDIHDVHRTAYHQGDTKAPEKIGISESRIVKDLVPLPPERLDRRFLFEAVCNALLPHVEAELQQENRIIFGQGSALLVRSCIHVLTDWAGRGLKLSLSRTLLIRVQDERKIGQIRLSPFFFSLFPFL